MTSLDLGITHTGVLGHAKDRRSVHTAHTRTNSCCQLYTVNNNKAAPGVQASIAHCGVAESAPGPIANRAPPNADPPYLLRRMSLVRI